MMRRRRPGPCRHPPASHSNGVEVTSISEQRRAIERNWRPRWALIVAWILAVVAGLATLVLALGLVAAGSWVVVILMMLWPEVVASVVVAAAAITFLARGGWGWFYVAVGTTIIGVVMMIVYVALHQ